MKGKRAAGKPVNEELQARLEALSRDMHIAAELHDLLRGHGVSDFGGRHRIWQMLNLLCEQPIARSRPQGR